MLEERLEALVGLIQFDSTLYRKLKVAVDSNAVAEIAKESGFTISVDDMSKAQYEVSDQELQVVDGEARSVTGYCPPNFYMD